MASDCLPWHQKLSSTTMQMTASGLKRPLNFSVRRVDISGDSKLSRRMEPGIPRFPSEWIVFGIFNRSRSPKSAKRITRQFSGSPLMPVKGSFCRSGRDGILSLGLAAPPGVLPDVRNDRRRFSWSTACGDACVGLSFVLIARRSINECGMDFGRAGC